MSIMQASFTLRGHNPDVLTCIANLSNDEVFTPPEFANQMLDTLAAAWADANDGADIWADPSVTFLDPFTKSGVFLREIVRRLTDGLILEIPDLAERVDHILTKQVFGIGITQLTALLARRSVYCSKFANGPHSIAKSFTTEDGNIWFERTEHTWGGGKREFRVNPLTSEEITVYTNRKCIYCGASEDSYARGDDLETHAYAFIHTDDIKARIAELFGDHMQFDVIIGNPPYQLGSDGGTRDVPIYQHFVEQAKLLEPRFLTMVIPSRWLATGLGLDEFRESMLERHAHPLDRRLPQRGRCLSRVGLKGGACYFLWDVNYDGACEVTTTSGAGRLDRPRATQLEGVRRFHPLQRGRSHSQARSSSSTSQGGQLDPAERQGVRLDLQLHRLPRLSEDRRRADLLHQVDQNGQVGYIARSEVSKSQELDGHVEGLRP